MFKKIIWGAVFISLITVGCAGEQIYRSSPTMQTVSTQHYEVKLEPLRAEGYNYYNQFRYTFTNKTNLLSAKRQKIRPFWVGRSDL